MSEYKENTVGWWLSQLKEPLKSRALEDCDPHLLKEFGYDSIFKALRAVWLSTRVRKGFWIGAMMYWISVCKEHQFLVEEEECKRDRCDDKAKEGWDMAKECAPDNWLKPKDGGEDKAIVDSPAPELIVTGAMIEDFGKRVNYPPTREIEAPERAVVGYEEPKPIDTIEKKHELRIKNLEAYNKYQAERNQQIMDINPHVDFCDSEGNLIRPSRMTALEARVKELEDQLFKLLGSKNG